MYAVLNTQPAKAVRIAWLDVLRGLAILLVVLYHFSSRYNDLHPAHAYAVGVPRVSFGWLGVELFFMISGFIIYFTIQRKATANEFLISRFARIVPPFWVAIVVCLGLELLRARLVGDAFAGGALDILFNFLLVADLTHSVVISGVFWSLFVEVKFYVVFAVLWAWFDMRKESTFLRAFVVLIVLAAINNFVRRYPLGFDINFFLLFWVGIAACKYLFESLPLRRYVLVTAAATLCAFVYPNPERQTSLVLATLVFAFAMVATPRLFERYALLEKLTAPLAALGRISYSLYLTHETIGYLLMAVLAGIVASQAMGIAAAFLVSLGVALASYRYIERRDRAIARALMQRLAPRPTTGTSAWPRRAARTVVPRAH